MILVQKLAQAFACTAFRRHKNKLTGTLVNTALTNKMQSSRKTSVHYHLRKHIYLSFAQLLNLSFVLRRVKHNYTVKRHHLVFADFVEVEHQLNQCQLFPSLHYCSIRSGQNFNPCSEIALVTVSPSFLSQLETRVNIK